MVLVVKIEAVSVFTTSPHKIWPVFYHWVPSISLAATNAEPQGSPCPCPARQKPCSRLIVFDSSHGRHSSLWNKLLLFDLHFLCVMFPSALQGLSGHILHHYDLPYKANALVWIRLPQFICWSLITNAMVLRKRVFGRWLKHEGGALIHGISEHIEEASGICLVFLSLLLCEARVPSLWPSA